MEFKQMLLSINWIKNVIIKIDENQSEFISMEQFIEKYQNLQNSSSEESNPDESDDDVKNSKNSKKENNEKNQKDTMDGKDSKDNNEKESKSNTIDNLQNTSQTSTPSSTVLSNTNQNVPKVNINNDSKEPRTISKPITNADKNNNNNHNKNNKLENKPEKTPTNNTNANKSKFLGIIPHASLTNNNNNKKNNKIKTTQDQATIMEAMGARYQKMVSSFNTNNIHNQSQLPPIIECKSECRSIDMYYSDTYGFTKFKFYNPIIKEFNIDLISNFAKFYKSKIHHQHNDYSHDLKQAVVRAPTGLACAFSEEGIFIPFVNISPTHVQFNVGKPVNKNEIPNGLAGLGELLSKENINDTQWILGSVEKNLFSIRMVNKMFKEKSNEFNIDFIINFGNIIRKKAWSRPDFESVIPNLDLSKYYFLA